MVFYTFSYFFFYLSGTDDVIPVDTILCIPIHSYKFSINDNKAVNFKSCPVAYLPKTVLMQLVTNSGPVPKERNSEGKKFAFTIFKQ